MRQQTANARAAVVATVARSDSIWHGLSTQSMGLNVQNGCARSTAAKLPLAN